MVSLNDKLKTSIDLVKTCRDKVENNQISTAEGFYKTLMLREVVDLTGGYRGDPASIYFELQNDYGLDVNQLYAKISNLTKVKPSKSDLEACDHAISKPTFIKFCNDYLEEAKNAITNITMTDI